MDLNAKMAYLQRIGTGKVGQSAMRNTRRRPMILTDKIKNINAFENRGNIERVDCSAHMSNLLDCLKENNQINSRCAQELAELAACNQRSKQSQPTQQKVSIRHLMKQYPSLASKEAINATKNNSTRLTKHKIKYVPKDFKITPKSNLLRSDLDD